MTDRWVPSTIGVVLAVVILSQTVPFAMVSASAPTTGTQLVSSDEVPGENGGESEQIHGQTTTAQLSEASPQPSEETVKVEYRVRHLPERPGKVSIRATLSVPDGTTKLEVEPFDDAVKTNMTGFERNGTSYAWDGQTQKPTLTFTAPVNVTDSGRYFTAGTTEWALFTTTLTRLSIDASRDGDPLQVASTYELAPNQTGYVGDGVIYLGNYSLYTNETSAGTVRLVVPEAASLVADREEVFSVLQHAHSELGPTDGPGTVTMFAAPDPIQGGVAPGVGTGKSAIVEDESLAGGPNPIWTHEYVHTRQEFEVSSEMAWIVEGSAQFFSYFYTMKQNKLDYGRFRSMVSPSEYQDVDLTNVESWSIYNPAAPYFKGARVIAAIDARIRQETDGKRSFEDVFRRMIRKDTEITYGEFKIMVSSVAGTNLYQFIDRNVQSEGNATAPDDPFLYTDGPDADPDGDTLTNELEREAGGNPFMADTDNDGLNDTVEYDVYGSGLADRDSDDDDIKDFREVERFGTDPTSNDTDGDGVLDPEEITDPALNETNPDTDGDGVEDGTEVARDTDPTEPDTDGDGVGDRAELTERKTPTPTATATADASTPTESGTPSPGAGDTAQSTGSAVSRRTTSASGPGILPVLLAGLAVVGAVRGGLRVCRWRQ